MDRNTKAVLLLAAGVGALAGAYRAYTDGGSNGTAATPAPTAASAAAPRPVSVEALDDAGGE